MGFGQGLSGLKAQAQKLDVIGNNIANAGTVGFKASSVSFADVYATSRVGLGTQVAAVNQNFGVGVISSTGGQFDMAIDGGSGMFRVIDSNGNVLYTRNGEFHANKDGFIVNAQGYQLTGYPAGSTAPQPIRVPSGNIAPQATTRITSEVNVDANVAPIDGTANVFDPLDPDTFHHKLPLTVYDALGNPHQVEQYFIKRPGAAAGDDPTWEVQYVTTTRDAAGDLLTLNPSQATIEFNSRGEFTGTVPSPVVLELTLTDTVAPTEMLEMQLNYAGSTQFGGQFSYAFNQDGFPTGEYSSMSVGPNGQIIAAYTNGEVQQMGDLVLARFTNLQGLQPVGGNAWRETSESGQPILGTPGSNGMSLLRGQALEDSNVDMGTELVNMIITQRTYQANAQTITTQSEVLQTLLNIR
ncbi:flagellar hook protein FlgE [Alcaligenaceae bacterium]|nr:flagellar hook protein FlgE [Alcaligenaceae bacterium]